MFHRLTPFGLCGALALYLLVSSLGFAQSPPTLAVQLQNEVASLNLRGDAGSPCSVQYATNLNGIWLTLANYTLPANAGQVLDPAPATNRQRFYRAVIVPPTNFVWVSGSTFQMGSPTNEAGRSSAETQHNVVLTKGYYVGQFLITQTNYTTLLHTNPSYFTPSHSFTADPNRPVEQVSWFDASNYCAQFTLQEQTAGRIFPGWSYRLPTEAEWEYACRAATATPFYLGTNLLSDMANFDGRYEYFGGTGTVFNASGTVLERTTAVGSYAPNNAALYDLAGNVWEWCADWYGSYPSGTVTNPPGPSTGTARVLRGGAFNSPGNLCRSANRNSTDPSSALNTVGFRLVLSAP